MRYKFDNRSFIRDMKNVMNYSTGFLDGVQLGKTRFMRVMGEHTIEMLKQYVDSNARLNPDLLHHIYEWHETGSPSSRLFDLDYTISNLGLSIKSTFSQSASIKEGSNVPFYDKARIMEYGIPVTIRPVQAQVLSFEDDGEQVFTRGPVTVSNPGGNVEGQYEKVFDSFFSKYFTQAFLRTSGIADYLENPGAYKKNLNSGKSRGRSVGVSTGFRWIVNAGLGGTT
jgi:hypothetical protein